MSQGNIFTKIQYGPEASAYGTKAVAWTELSRVQSSELNSDNGNIYDRGSGEGINAVKTYYGKFEASGNVVFNPVSFDFLKHWVGGKSGAGSSSGDPFELNEATSTDTTAGATVLQPFSLERTNDVESTDSTEWGLGCMGTDFTLSGAINEKLVCNANFVGQKTTFKAATGETYTPVDEAAFIMLNGTWKWGATPSAISGVREFTISYANGLILETRSIESRFMNMPQLGQRVYTFSVGIIMASALATTIINDFYGDVSSGTYTPEDGSTSISPTSSLEFKVELVNGSKYANLQLDECAIDRISKPNALGGGLVMLTFEGTARQGKSNQPIVWWSV